MLLYFAAVVAAISVVDGDQPERPNLDVLIAMVAAHEYSWNHIVALNDEMLNTAVPISRNDATAITNEDHWTLLAIAVLADDWPLACYLIGRGADVNKTTSFGHSPLWLIAGKKQSNDALAVAQLLLARGADPNSIPIVGVELPTGITPLHLAIQRQNLPLIQLLITYGADPSRMSSDQKTPRVLLDEEITRRSTEHRESIILQRSAFMPESVDSNGSMTDDELKSLRERLIRGTTVP